MKREEFSLAKQAGITALNGMLQTNGGAAKATGHDPSSVYCRWAYAIAEAPHEMPIISVTKALGAFEFWGIKPPVNLIAKAEKLQMVDKHGNAYKVNP
jgi:hypothetical protein